MPNVTFLPSKPLLMFITYSLSTLRTTVPLGAMFSSSSRFASAILSSVPKNSMCTGPMFVYTATSGRVRPASMAISPL